MSVSALPGVEVEAVLALAAQLTACRCCALQWYRHDAIAEFGGRTAQALVADGQGAVVLGFLRAIAGGERG